MTTELFDNGTSTAILASSIHGPDLEGLLRSAGIEIWGTFHTEPDGDKVIIVALSSLSETKNALGIE